MIGYYEEKRGRLDTNAKDFSTTEFTEARRKQNRYCLNNRKAHAIQRGRPNA